MLGVGSVEEEVWTKGGEEGTTPAWEDPQSKIFLFQNCFGRIKFG